MNTNDKGNLGYAMVIADVIKRGYFIFTPFADTTCVDLIIANSEMKLMRTQIKYRTINKKGTLEIATSGTVNGKRVPTDLTMIDMWAVYCPNTDKIYYIPTKHLIGKKYMFLRVNDAIKTNNLMNYANDFIELNF